MRIRLRIERNELPAVSILWAISDTEQKQTIAQFLERVNERFPLEGESWGLEDYAVTVSGYEALHYNEVGLCFQSEDEVVIRPLQYVDVRARTMTGRNQISEDGRHLVDGVPFGRPLLKRARRPEITIPPRKRQKLDSNTDQLNEELGEDDEDDEEYDDDDSSEESSEQEEEILLLPENGQNLHEDQRAEELEDEGDSDNDAAGVHEKPLVNGRIEEQVSDTRQSKRRSSRVPREHVVHETESSESDDDSASSSSEDSDSSLDDSSSSDDSDSSSDQSSADSEESWEGIDIRTSPDPAALKVEEEGTAQSNSPPERLSSRGLPFEGLEKTKIRNSRRREQRKLKHLKEAGTLPAGATLTDLYAYQEKHEVPSKVDLQRQNMEEKRQRLLDQIATGGVDVAASNGVNGDSNMLPDTPEEELAVSESVHKPALSSITELSTDQLASANGPDSEIQRKAKKSKVKNSVSTEVAEEPSHIESATTSRRARLDAAGTNRLIFGSLGVRTPKTQAEKDALQEKLAGRPKRNAIPETSDRHDKQETTEEDPDAWQDRIDLSAVECVDEGVTLSTPPFPFVQRWDPQYQYSRRKRQKKREQAASYGEQVETYDKYNANGCDALKYDDPDEDDADDEYWEEGALLDDRVEDDEDESAHDGFPELPDDIALLSTLTETDAREGDFVVFEELACSAATGWQPKTTIRTVRLEGKDDSGWQVRYATRDLRPREFDDEGNRIYSKFEMEGLSDDEGDEGSSLLWEAMTNARLLQRVG